MIFPGLSSAIVINRNTIDMLSKYVTHEDFLSSDAKDIEKYLSKRRSERIRKIARDSPGKITQDGDILIYQDTESPHG